MTESDFLGKELEMSQGYLNANKKQKHWGGLSNQPTSGSQDQDFQGRLKSQKNPIGNLLSSPLSLAYLQALTAPFQEILEKGTGTKFSLRCLPMVVSSTSTVLLSAMGTEGFAAWA